MHVISSIASPCNELPYAGTRKLIMESRSRDPLCTVLPCITAPTTLNLILDPGSLTVSILNEHYLRRNLAVVVKWR